MNEQNNHAIIISNRYPRQISIGFGQSHPLKSYSFYVHRNDILLGQRLPKKDTFYEQMTIV